MRNFFTQDAAITYSLSHPDENGINRSTECYKANPHLTVSDEGIPMKILEMQSNHFAITAKHVTFYAGNVLCFFP